MLETTLATAFIPGSNLRGSVSGANWLFLLPCLELQQTVCLGVPPVTTLIPLSRFSQDVAVISAEAQPRHWLAEVKQRHGLTNVRLVVADRGAALPLPDSSVDLAVVAIRSGGRQLHPGGAWRAELQRLLKPTGLMYFESGGPMARLLNGSRLREVGGSDARDHFRLQPFWLTPLAGEMETAVPVHDHATIRYFFRRGLYSPLINQGILGRLERWLGQHPRLSPLTRRYGVLMGHATADGADPPPQYLRRIAQEAGIDIGQYRWGLAARGKYNSRKVRFVLFDPASETPKYIVKMTRDPNLNFRLENEARALALLWAKGVGHRETLPQVAFFGHHANLAILGETVIEGAPLGQKTRATAACPYAHAAINWLIDLATATADRAVVAPKQVTDVLGVLFERFVQLYQPASAHRDFLADQIAAIGCGPYAFPVVFQHGDPGIWNILVTPGGRAAFLDWEAAEPQGMPLWDLFYFLRSYSLRVARAHGTPDGLTGFAQQFMAESPLSPLMIESVGRYCEETGLTGHLIEPLFYTCWMHRALKEATRLPPDRLESGHYVNLLRLCIDRREAPTLRRLFAPLTADASA